MNELERMPTEFPTDATIDALMWNFFARERYLTLAKTILRRIWSCLILIQTVNLNA